MSNKVTLRREQTIVKAAQENNWKEVSRLLQQEQNNAERRDRYHHKRSFEENVSQKDSKKREQHEVIANSDLTPEEALIQKERSEAIKLAKEKALTQKERDIVEMIAEQNFSYKKTARQITIIYGKISDVTVKDHYLKALKKLEIVLSDYR